MQVSKDEYVMNYDDVQVWHQNLTNFPQSAIHDIHRFIVITRRKERKYKIKTVAI